MQDSQAMLKTSARVGIEPGADSAGDEEFGSNLLAPRISRKVDNHS